MCANRCASVRSRRCRHLRLSVHRPIFKQILLALTFTLLAIPARPAVPEDAAAPPAMKRVLLLHQEGISRPFRTQFDAAFIEALRLDESDPIDLDEEAIATERFPGPQQSRFITEYLRNKYAGRRIDVIVTVGNRALTFARENRGMFGDPAIVAV